MKGFPSPPPSLVWHQNNRHMISQLADFFLHSILRLPRRRRTRLVQHMNLFLNFFISGLLHTSVDMASGIPWRESGALRFFCTQVIGIAMEEIAQKIYHQNHQHQYRRHQANPQANHSSSVQPTPPPPPSAAAAAASVFRPTVLIGYIWVIMFITWSFPAWAYPALYRSRGGEEDSFLRFSILARFVNKS